MERALDPVCSRRTEKKGMDNKKRNDRGSYSGFAWDPSIPYQQPSSLTDLHIKISLLSIPTAHCSELRPASLAEPPKLPHPPPWLTSTIRLHETFFGLSLGLRCLGVVVAMGPLENRTAITAIPLAIREAVLQMW